jgi:short-subunit dehydrogenase
VQTDGIAGLLGMIKLDFGGAPDVLIHTAGIATAGRIEDTPATIIRDVLAVNLLAAMALTAALVPEMRSRRSGLLVFVSSGTAYFGVPTEAPYCASKAGLERFVESLRGELLGSGVFVSVVSPGPVETSLMRRPNTYGAVEPVARPRIAAQPETVADRIVLRLAEGSDRIELSWRGYAVRHLSYWSPALLRHLVGGHSSPPRAAPEGSQGSRES